MTTEKDQVIFRRCDSADNKSDIWDDTALIEAYDQAVKSVQSQLATKFGEDEEVKPTKQKSKRKKNKGKRKQKEKQQWHAGDHCRAVFTEDGLVYEAVLESVNPKNKTCIVKYLGYGNEEEHSLCDLLNSLEAEDQDDISESDPGADYYPDPHNSRTSSQHGRTPPKSSRPKHGAMPPPPSFGMPPPPPMSGFPFMQPGFPTSSFMGGWPQPTMPMMSMPPPPPLDDIDDIADDKEALHSMLVSWYMSGYHTGYYNGLKHGKKTARDEAT